MTEWENACHLDLSPLIICSSSKVIPVVSLIHLSYPFLYPLLLSTLPGSAFFFLVHHSFTSHSSLCLLISAPWEESVLFDLGPTLVFPAVHGVLSNHPKPHNSKAFIFFCLLFINVQLRFNCSCLCCHRNILIFHDL